MDISALTKQYRKLRERQKQAHVILTGENAKRYFITFLSHKSALRAVQLKENRLKIDEIKENMCFVDLDKENTFVQSNSLTK